MLLCLIYFSIIVPNSQYLQRKTKENNVFGHLGVCLSLNKSARYARRDKHTPCIKTNRLKRQNRSRAERAVRAKPLGESGPFFSHIGNAIFCLLFHRRICSFFISSCEICFLSFRRTHPIPHSFTTPFYPLKTYFYHANYLSTHSHFKTDICYAVGSSYHNRVRTEFGHDFKLVQSAHNDVLVCSFAHVYDVYCSQHVKV